MTEFDEMCQSGCMTGSDGTGYYATSSKMSDLNVNPNRFVVRVDYTHVMWFNK